MTPKEKADSLVRLIGYEIGKELPNGGYKFNIERAKQCALIAVNEISWVLDEIDYNIHTDNGIKFYNEVKQEIEKL